MITTKSTVIVIQVLWSLWLIVWLWLSRGNKRAEIKDRKILYRVPMIVGFALMLIGLPPLDQADEDFFSRSFELDLAAIVLTAIGLGWAIYARIYLGRDWSGTVQLKSDHRLVQSGPYGLTRHPIYTGLLTAFFGLACFLDRWLEIPGYLLVVCGFWLKLRREEIIMAGKFGPAYEAYRRRVKALLPLIV